jgi:branched-chain amino acid transport system permease protein
LSDPGSIEKTEAVGDIREFSWRMFATIGTILIILFLLPWILSNRFYLRLATEILIYGLLAMSLDVLLGYTGLLSFMHAVYMGIAAYTVGLYLKYVDPAASIWLLMFLGVGATVLIAFPIGWLQVRTGGFAFALLTIAFGMMLYTIVWKARNLTGGDDGLIGIPSPNVNLSNLVLADCKDPTSVYFITLIVVILCFCLARRIMRSPFGAVLESIRENEERASFVGIHVHRYKLCGWMLACALAGVSGVLLTIMKCSVSPTVMDPGAGGSVLMMALLGGLGTLWGPFLGAGVFIFAQDYISTMTEHWMIFLGLFLIVLVLFVPKGIAGFQEALSIKKSE